MRDKRLYRVIEPNGAVRVSPIRPSESGYSITHRLIADEGMELVNGESRTYCIDTDDPSPWFEEPAIEQPDPLDGLAEDA